MLSAAPTLRTKLAYGFGSVAFGVKDNGFAFFLLLYYNQVLGLPERWVGLAIMVALVVDAFADPIVGFLSDHLHSPWGRRHPFMYASAIPVGFCYYLLWDPPQGLSHAQLFGYLVVVAIIVRVLIACYEIPSASLAAELTDDYDQRTAILSFRYFFGWWGGLIMAVLAYLVFLQPDADSPVGVLNADGYRRYGITAAMLMAAAIFISALGTHSFIPHLRKPPAERPAGVGGLLRELRESLANRSFLALFGATVFTAMAAGLVAALNLYFNTFFWELTSNEISIITLGVFFSAAAALALAPRLSVRFGKKAAALGTAVSAGFLGQLPIMLRLVGAFPANHSPALMPTLLVFNIVVVTLYIVATILGSSMIADTVEDSEIVTGRRSEGVFFAANSFVQKAVSGTGIFASTVLLAAVGFPAGAKPGEVDPAVVRDLGLIYIPAILVMYAGTVAFLSAYRIDRQTHESNLARLRARGDSGDRTSLSTDRR
jgi:Na+/melibiose symporter-like transporter